MVQLDAPVLQQPVPAVLESDDLRPVPGVAGADDRTDNRIEAGAVATAGQNSDAHDLHLTRSGLG
jgi:hypothetical protein